MGAVVAGWRERVDLPDWGIDGLRAKLDTGARTSALHVTHVMELGDGRVTFEVLPRRRSDRRVPVTALLVRITRVRSSTGSVTTRHVVRTRLRMGTIEREIELTLVDRGAMIHRMLIGRTGLTGVVVDPSRRYVITQVRKDPG
ncbi:MAG: RimK/LysX family protein [Kofleriaceae bacterium]